MNRTVRSMAIAAAMGALLIPSPASAHESREVGPFEVVVGWWEEPAFANQPNGPEISISRNGEPVVEGVELEVELTYGEESTTHAIEPAFVVNVFGEPGSYNADLFPTRAGTWEFRFTGTIGGEEIDELFTSGPETFSDIVDPASVAFPAADPSNADIAARVERDAERLEADVTAAGDDASRASLLGYIGIGVGVLALIGAGLALRRRPG